MAYHYFPNQSPEMQALELRLRAEAKGLPESARLRLYEIFSEATPSLTPTKFIESDSMVLAVQRGAEIAFPRPVPMVKLSHIVFGYEEWLQRKYCLPNFVEVEAGDTVIDCGAYVGGFSISAARIARAVHAFEPDEANFQCLTRNLSFAGNATLNQAGLYSKSKTMNLNISESSVEHSLLPPDDGTTIAVRPISVLALRDYVRDKRIAKLDFVKIEAEGVELEVFDGLGGIRPRKLAIDVSPERNGESPAPEFQKRLARLGYLIRQRGHVMFALQP